MKDLEIIENLIKIRDTAGNNAKEDILKESGLCVNCFTILLYTPL